MEKNATPTKITDIPLITVEKQDKTKRIETVRRAQTTVKIAIRAASCNKDIIYLLLVCLSSICLGYFVADAANHLWDILISSAIFFLSAVIKIITVPGFISTKFTKIADGIFAENFRRKIFSWNLDIIILILCCASCAWLGFVLHNVFVSVAETVNVATLSASTQNYNIIDLLGVLILVVITIIAKLAVNKGYISEEFGKKISNVLDDIFKKKEDIDINTYKTIIK